MPPDPQPHSVLNPTPVKASSRGEPDDLHVSTERGRRAQRSPGSPALQTGRGRMGTTQTAWPRGQTHPTLPPTAQSCLRAHPPSLCPWNLAGPEPSWAGLLLSTLSSPGRELSVEASRGLSRGGHMGLGGSRCSGATGQAALRVTLFSLRILFLRGRASQSCGGSRRGGRARGRNLKQTPF